MVRDVAIAAWILVGCAFGVAAYAYAPSRLPFGWPVALVAGTLGAIVGATGELLIDGRSRFELLPSSVGGAAVGATLLLVLITRAADSEPSGSRWSDVH